DEERLGTRLREQAGIVRGEEAVPERHRRGVGLLEIVEVEALDTCCNRPGTALVDQRQLLDAKWSQHFVERGTLIGVRGVEACSHHQLVVAERAALKSLAEEQQL